MKSKTVDAQKENIIKIEGIEYVVIKKSDLDTYKKAKKNLEYLEEINRRFEEVKAGKYEKHNLVEV